MAPPLPPPPVKRKSVLVPLLAVIVVVIIVAAALSLLHGGRVRLTPSTYSVGQSNQLYRSTYDGTDCWLYTT